MRPPLAEALWFAGIGGAAAISFALLSAVLIQLQTGVPDWVVSASCYAAFIVPVYVAHRRLSFRSTVPHRIALPRYAAVQVVGLTLATALSFACYELFALEAYLAAPLVITATSGLTFVILRSWAFAAGAVRGRE